MSASDSKNDQPNGEKTDFDAAHFLKTLSTRPGVYKMYDAADKVIYVGKARNLKKRVSSYFNREADTPKISALVARIARIEVSVTATEDEALLLEGNLIKQHRPRYNIALRDDKSYPYVRISGNHEFPQLSFHRGARRKPHRYFGPYASAGAVRDTLGTLHKLFRLRQCSDSYFANRSRPCLQYQIQRCSAPCVGYISAENYAQDVNNATLLLQGKGDKLGEKLTRAMQQAAQSHEFEKAALYRDQIAALSRLQEQGYQAASTGSADIVCADIHQGIACVVVGSYRHGRNLGQRQFFPSLPSDSSLQELLSAFLGQYYTEREPPPEIITSTKPDEKDWLETALSRQSQALGKGKVSIKTQVRGMRRRWLEQTEAAVQPAITSRLADKAGSAERVETLQAALKMAKPPEHIECFDISHHQGDKTVASCVVFRQGQPDKSSYRRFNITGITPGDDYAAMNQALDRRFKRLTSDKDGQGEIPDLLLIDGGKGQLMQAIDILNEYEVSDLTVIGVAKGVERRAGEEQLLSPDKKSPLRLPGNSPALHLIQQVRDEAHRFAITGHRGQHGKANKGSILDDIPGLGPVKRKQLLTRFGGARQVSRAGVEDLLHVEGISKTLAQAIYDHFH